jgi:hypothetical protein
MEEEGGRAPHLDTEGATVDIVSEEEVGRLGRVAANLEKLEQVVLQ